MSNGSQKKDKNIIPAKAGIHVLFISGFRVKHGMTNGVVT